MLKLRILYCEAVSSLLLAKESVTEKTRGVNPSRAIFEKDTVLDSEIYRAV